MGLTGLCSPVTPRILKPAGKIDIYLGGLSEGIEDSILHHPGGDYSALLYQVDFSKVKASSIQSRRYRSMWRIKRNPFRNGRIRNLKGFTDGQGWSDSSRSCTQPAGNIPRGGGGGRQICHLHCSTHTFLTIEFLYPNGQVDVML